MDYKSATYEVRRKLGIAMALLAIVVFSGTFSFMIVEKWSFHDSFFMTVITMSTVGFSEVNPLSDSGRIVTVFLIISSLTFGTYALSTLTTHLVSGEVVEYIKGQNMEKTLRKLRDHYILAGFGKLGQHVADEFKQENAPFVIIERDDNLVRLAREAGFFVMQGDATNDDILSQAGVERARGLIAAVSGDAGNVLLTISARTMNPGIKIVARANESDSEVKLRRAGADRVVIPFESGGRRMANQMLNPGFVDFIDMFSRTYGHSYSMEEFVVQEKSKLNGKTLMDVDFRAITKGAIVLAVLKGDGRVIPHPEGSQGFNIGDKMIVFCDRDQVKIINEKLIK